MLGVSGVDEAGGLTTVDNLSKSAMQKGVLDVELMSLPIKRERDGEDDTHGGWFDKRAECLVEVDTWLLRETSKHPMSFIAIEGAIGLELVAKNPLAGDVVSIPRRRHKIPSVVAEESAVLRSHSIEPVGILESCTGGGGDRRVPADR